MQRFYPFDVPFEALHYGFRQRQGSVLFAFAVMNCQYTEVEI